GASRRRRPHARLPAVAHAGRWRLGGHRPGGPRAPGEERREGLLSRRAEGDLEEHRALNPGGDRDAQRPSVAVLGCTHPGSILSAALGRHPRPAQPPAAADGSEREPHGTQTRSTASASPESIAPWHATFIGSGRVRSRITKAIAARITRKKVKLPWRGLAVFSMPSP